MLEFLDFIKGFDLHHIISMIAVFWFMTRRLENKISNLDQRIDQLQNKITAFDIRMSVMESEISHVSTNINHMMWHNQTLYHRDSKEE